MGAITLNKKTDVIENLLNKEDLEQELLEIQEIIDEQRYIDLEELKELVRKRESIQFKLKLF